MDTFRFGFKISAFFLLKYFPGNTLMSSLFPDNFIFVLAYVFVRFCCLVPFYYWNYWPKQLIRSLKWSRFGKYFKMILLNTSTLVVWMASMKYWQLHWSFLSLKIETIAVCVFDPSSSHVFYPDSSRLYSPQVQHLKCLNPPH